MFTVEQPMIHDIVFCDKNQSLYHGIIIVWLFDKTPDMKYSIHILLTVCLLIVSCHLSRAQSNSPNSLKDLEQSILFHDSIFWVAYNACNVEKMLSYFTEDLEFYHDKNGLTTPKATFDEAVRTGLCGNPDFRLRREVIPGTVKVFPMNNFGALISGEHLFYVNEKGKKEYLDGYGKFTHLWKLTDNTWKMSRVISYDHGPPPFINKRKEVILDDRELQRLSGNYKAARGIATVSVDQNSLKLAMGNFELVLVPEAKTKFFARDRDLQVEFVVEQNQVKKLLVYEKGKIVDELVKQ